MVAILAWIDNVCLISLSDTNRRIISPTHVFGENLITETRKLRVFPSTLPSVVGHRLCHSSMDKPIVRELPRAATQFRRLG